MSSRDLYIANLFRGRSLAPSPHKGANDNKEMDDNGLDHVATMAQGFCDTADSGASTIAVRLGT